MDFRLEHGIELKSVHFKKTETKYQMRIDQFGCIFF